jgi:hypothetical protein
MELVFVVIGLLPGLAIGLFFGRLYVGGRKGSGDGDQLRLELDDMYDKIRHLYDRTRKRQDALQRTEATPEDDGALISPKAALRAQARAKGLIR